MVILGIDPGFSFTGFGILSIKPGKRVLLDYGYVTLKPKDHLTRRLGIFFDFFDKKITNHSVSDIAIETPFLGKNAQNFLKLGYLRGAIYLLTDRYTLYLHEYSPREVKKSVTGYGAASKEQVCRSIKHLFPQLTVPAKLDVSDALAVTLCAAWKAKPQ